ncbi:MAG: Rrf2 family transcriptional regulator [Candidatus Omnitrophica bacterium]|nr:Rrf2 family transcriptional regulator [Candidatus Omnitrophota bacterium]
MIHKKAKYGLKVLSVLGEEYPAKEPRLIAELAASARVPKKFLELILLDLKNHGILQSKKGKGGGYFLAKPPGAIKLGAVLRILGGPLAPLPCLSQTAYEKCEECPDEANCNLRLIMKEVYEAQTSFLDSHSLEDMLNKTRRMAEIGTYAI